MIPTRERCQEIIKNNECFYCTSTTVNGFEVEMYDYRLASYKDFKDNDAFELRGLTFVKNGDRWYRNIALQKFFNLGQNEDWYYDDVKHKTIQRVQNKEDGSLITLVSFPEGPVRAKSKMSFESEQAKMAQEIYDTNENYRRLKAFCDFSGLTPIFELVSPFNQIVLDYAQTDLVILQIRKSASGEYLGPDRMNKICEEFKIPNTRDLIPETLEYYIDAKRTMKGIEGWVITLDDGQMLKVKTDEYLSLHGILTELRIDNIIEMTLNETIDDALAVATGEKRVFIIDVMERTIEKFNILVRDYLDLRRMYFNDFNENRKEFALEHKDKPMFGWVMRTLESDYKEVPQVSKKAVKEYILKQTNSLSKAKEFLG